MKIVLSVSCAVLMFLSASSVFAQATTGNLEGFALDQEGQPLSGAYVTVTSPQLQGARTVLSQNDGYFVFLNTPVGIYTVTVMKDSYREVTIADVEVRLGRTTGVGEVRLTDTSYELEELVVHGRKALIDPASTTTGYSFAYDEFMNLPVERDYAQMMEFLPHANRSYIGDPLSDGIDFNGATDIENRYFIEGVEATEPFWGSGGLSLPYNFVKEVQIRSGGYQAEYRGALGGAVDVITHSGSNEFRGQVFGYYIDNRLAADPRLAVGDPPQGDFESYDVGIGIGGAIKRDKLWYYISFNPAIINENVEIPTLGFYPDESRTYRFAGKISWRLSERNDLALSVLGAPSQRSAVWNVADGWGLGVPSTIESEDSYLLDIENKPFVFSLEDFHWLGDSFLLEASAALHDSYYEEMPTTEKGVNEPFFLDEETGTWGGGHVGWLKNDFTTIDLGVKATAISDRHTAKAGLAFRDRSGRQTGDYSMLIRGVDPVDGEWYYLWSYSDNPDSPASSSRLLSAFAQDAWRLSERVRLNLGVRWDGQYIIDGNGNIGLSLLDQWQPRFGFTFQPGRLGSRKVFGNYGRYYQEIGSVLASVFIAGESSSEVLYDHDPRVDPSGGIVLSQSSGEIHEKIEGIDGQYYDEFTLGYEQTLGQKAKIVLRGILRSLGKGVEHAYKADTLQVIGNPGHGDISEFPKMRREYRALEMMFQVAPSRQTGLLFSYVLSRNWGNYTGLNATDYGTPFPNLTEAFDLMETTVNSLGLLPNDRTHTLKLSGWYRTSFGLTVGAAGWWMSGTPLTEFGTVALRPVYRTFLSARGSAGRTPSIWDLSLRFAYELGFQSGGTHPQLIVDLLHVGSPSEAVDFDQQKYWSQDADGNPTDSNATYGTAIRYQPAMAVRFGVRVDF